MPPAVLAAAEGASPAHLETDPHHPQHPDWRFLFRSPWHLIALGFGSGLPRLAPGTWGTAFAWASFSILDRWLDDPGWTVLVAGGFVIGMLAAQRTGARLGDIDSSHIVIDEVVAFWIVLWLLPTRAPTWVAALAFVLFRMFDIAKPAPIKRLDARMKNGFGVMLDDIVAAFYTLLVIAVLWRLMR
ncbi:MAG TPA: phosphatidylglycerophosphatase A [Burkholderiaceae bacterium]|nr:phosphatidylglycerophosphatase A [Burkholderiaceae bacterium]